MSTHMTEGSVSEESQSCGMEELRRSTSSGVETLPVPTTIENGHVPFEESFL